MSDLHQYASGVNFARQLVRQARDAELALTETARSQGKRHLASYAESRLSELERTLSILLDTVAPKNGEASA